MNLANTCVLTFFKTSGDMVYFDIGDGIRRDWVSIYSRKKLTRLIENVFINKDDVDKARLCIFDENGKIRSDFTLTQEDICSFRQEYLLHAKLKGDH